MVSQFELSVLEWMKQIRLVADRKLRSSLDRASRNGALGAYGTLTRLQCLTALMSANSSLDQVTRMLKDLILTETSEQGAASLCG